MRRRRIISVWLIATLLLTAGGGEAAAKTKKKAGLRLNISSLKMKVGEKKKIKLIYKKSGKVKNIKYTTLSKKIAAVTKKGIVTAKKSGKTKIRCTFCYKAKKKEKYKKKSLLCKVTVSGAKPSKTPTTKPTNKPLDKPSDKPSDKPVVTPPNKPELTPSAEPQHTPSVKPEEEQGTISGLVKAKQGSNERRELAGAEVTIYDDSGTSVDTVVTTENGIFCTKKLTAGKMYRVTIRKDGFREKEFENVAVEADREAVPGGGEIVLLSQSVGIITTNTAVARVMTEEQAGETPDVVITAPNDAKAETIASAIMNPEGGTVSLQGKDTVCVTAEDTSVKKEYKLVLKERPEAHGTRYDYKHFYEEKYYQFWLEYGLHSDSEEGDRYEIYLCNEVLSDTTQIPESEVMPIVFHKEEDYTGEDRYVKADEAYLRVYVRRRETDEDFPSKWRESTYGPRGVDNAFRFDNIP